ncbi:hypothetical protein RDWZM_009197 [Blomia tropicalis]|uniref:ZZ-type domain-containing protein n=1 Tax=Blomia tropicalis TaxID=40697 RepID=A0A9Q0M2N9_BLOTA|nr:hypothetical protein RDWZM_009197 [Blomia tropicalis]
MLQSSAESESTLKTELSFKETVEAKFNAIRFPHYRIASKLRYLQKISNFHMIDLFNTLESFREFGLNGAPNLNSMLANSQIYSIVNSLFTQLSQRILNGDKLNVEYSSDLIYNWLINTYDLNQSGSTNIFALKVALTLLCSDSYSNKLRYLFTLLSNDGSSLVEEYFNLYLKHILSIARYFEDISIFFYDEDLHSSVFDFSSPISLQNFLDVLTCFENQADFTSWMIVYHRLAEAEKVVHQINCNACGQNNFHGFRYKCKKCNNYSLCQQCFWTGKSSGNHDPDKHPCKEYLMEKPKNQLRNSIRKSFRNSFRRVKSPPVSKQNDEADKLTRKHLNLRDIISSPQLRRRELMVNYEYRFQDHVIDKDSLSNLVVNDEHDLIAHYLYLLDNKSEKQSTSAFTTDDNKSVQTYEKTIEQLENRNRELMQRISKLKEVKGESFQNNARTESPQSIESSQTEKSVFFEELVALRHKKDDLENHLNSLQDRRKVLMVQIDNLMNEFKHLKPTEDTLNLTTNVPNKDITTDNLIQRLGSNSINTVPQYYDPVVDDRELVGVQRNYAF